MKLIFTAKNDMEAHFVQGLLDQEGIKSVIQGEALEGAWGDMRVSDKSLPTLWVNDPDVATAEPIVAEYDARERAAADARTDGDGRAAKTWKCPKCGEEVEDQFDECWNCGAEKPTA
jgi:hypothetical protein